MEDSEVMKGGEGFIDRSKVRILLCDNDTKSSEEVFVLLYKCSYQDIAGLQNAYGSFNGDIWGEINTRAKVDLGAFVQNIFDPTQRLKDLADMLTIHYYLLFDGSNELWPHMKSFYQGDSIFSFAGKEHVGQDKIYATLTDIRRTFAGDWPPEKLVHLVEKVKCRAEPQGVAIRVSGSFIVGNQFLICGDGVHVEGLPNFRDVSIDISSKRMGSFQEQFIMKQTSMIGRHFIAKQELYIVQ